MSVATHDVHKTGNEIKFSPEAQLLVDKHLAKYPEGKKKSAILPLLHLAQQELGGWLSVDVQDYIASILKIAPIEVYEVVTFYSQYYTKPVGKYVFEVCRTSPCKLRGSDEIIEYIENKLSIKDGQTTPDGMFTLKTVECLAACGMAPVMQCGLPYHEFLTEEKVDNIINDCIAENKVSRAFF